MLKHKLIHPEINAILGAAGHHSKVLIADGNYPVASKKGPNAKLVHLNLMPGLVTCNQVLEAIFSAIPIEVVNAMGYETTGPYALSEDPPVWSHFQETIKISEQDIQWEVIEKWNFYDAVSTDDHVLTIQTGDQQRFANLLLTIGVRMD